MTVESPVPWCEQLVCVDPLIGSLVRLRWSDLPWRSDPAHLSLPAQKTNALNNLVSEQRLVLLLVQFDFYSST